MPLDTDLVQTDRWAARIDRIKEAVGALQLLQSVAELVVLTHRILPVRDHDDHAPRSRLGGLAQILGGLDHGVEEGRRLFGRIDRQRGRDGFVNAYDPRVDQFGSEADCEYGSRVVRFEHFLQEPGGRLLLELESLVDAAGNVE